MNTTGMCGTFQHIVSWNDGSDYIIITFGYDIYQKPRILLLFHLMVFSTSCNHIVSSLGYFTVQAKL